MSNAQRPPTQEPHGSDLPPGLEEFGVRLAKVAEIRAEEERHARKRRRWRSFVLPVAVTVVTAAAGAGAVKIVDRAGKGKPLKPEPGKGAQTLQPAKDPAVVTSSAVADPDGGPPWVLRAYTNAEGGSCVQVGRLSGGDFGQVQRGEFRKLPTSAPGQCSVADERGPLVAVERRGANRTLVYGLAVDRDAPVTVSVGDVRKRVRPAGLGAFVTVFTGADRTLPIVVTSKAGGRTIVQRPGA
jgi:hypothetical protein